MENKQDSKPTTKKPLNKQLNPDWKGKCEVCGASPIVPATGMCGPCTFGEEDYDAHQKTHHPQWSIALIKKLDVLNMGIAILIKTLERVSSAVEGRR